MHLNNLTDQTLAAYTNHVIHIRISHTFGNYQRSCYLLNGSSAHLNQSPAFLSLITEKNIGANCRLHGFLYIFDTCTCISGNSGNLNDRRHQLLTVFTDLSGKLGCQLFRNINNRIFTGCQTVKLLFTICRILHRKSIKAKSRKPVNAVIITQNRDLIHTFPLPFPG